MIPDPRNPRRDGWKIIGTILPDQRSGLYILRLGRFQILIRYVDLRFELVQLRVLENLPPCSACNRIVGLRSRPIGRQFLVRRRRWRGGTRIAWAHFASGQEHNGNEKSQQPDPVPRVCECSEVHCASPVDACAIRTGCPEMIESGGFTMIDSSPCNPPTISMRSPKSCPGSYRRQHGLAIFHYRQPEPFFAEQQGVHRDHIRRTSRRQFQMNLGVRAG